MNSEPVVKPGYVILRSFDPDRDGKIVAMLQFKDRVFAATEGAIWELKEGNFQKVPMFVTKPYEGE